MSSPSVQNDLYDCEMEDVVLENGIVVVVPQEKAETHLPRPHARDVFGDPGVYACVVCLAASAQLIVYTALLACIVAELTIGLLFWAEDTCPAVVPRAVWLIADGAVNGVWFLLSLVLVCLGRTAASPEAALLTRMVYTLYSIVWTAVGYVTLFLECSATATPSTLHTAILAFLVVHSIFLGATLINGILAFVFRKRKPNKE